MSQTVCAITFATLIGLSGAAWAAAPSFDELDVDRDGQLSRSEATKNPDLDFAKADTNKDGKLDRSEYAAAIG